MVLQKTILFCIGAGLTAAGLLLGVVLWMSYLTLFSWWAGTGPPSSDASIYMKRAELYWRVGVTAFGGAVYLAVLVGWLILHRKQPCFTTRTA